MLGYKDFYRAVSKTGLCLDSPRGRKKPPLAQRCITALRGSCAGEQGQCQNTHCSLCARPADVGASPHKPGRASPPLQRCFCSSWGCSQRKQSSRKQLERRRIPLEFSVSFLQKPFDNWEHIREIKPSGPGWFLGAHPRNPDPHGATFPGIPKEMHLCTS